MSISTRPCQLFAQFSWKALTSLKHTGSSCLFTSSSVCVSHVRASCFRSLHTCLTQSGCVSHHRASQLLSPPQWDVQQLLGGKEDGRVSVQTNTGFASAYHPSILEILNKRTYISTMWIGFCSIPMIESWSTTDLSALLLSLFIQSNSRFHFLSFLFVSWPPKLLSCHSASLSAYRRLRWRFAGDNKWGLSKPEIRRVETSTWRVANLKHAFLFRAENVWVIRCWSNIPTTCVTVLHPWRWCVVGMWDATCTRKFPLVVLFCLRCVTSCDLLHC